MGDYKVVVADQDGKASSVIKLGYGTYTGKYGEEKAEAAVYKLSRIYELANEIVPGVALPTEWRIVRGQQGYQVYEVQQRALPIDFNFFDPKTAECLIRESREIWSKGTDRLRRELLKRGISRRNTYFDFEVIADQLALSEIVFDLITGRLVSLDIVDRLDITPVLPDYIKPTGVDLG